MQTNPSIKSKLVLAYGWQGGERRKELPRKDKYVYYLVCGDGHEYMYMSKCIELYAFKYMQYIVHQLYLNKAVGREGEKEKKERSKGERKEKGRNHGRGEEGITRA